MQRIPVVGRREFLTGVTGLMLFLPGCEFGEDIGDDDDDDDTIDVPDEAVDATPNDVIVRGDDLETGWRVTEIDGGQGTYHHGGNSLAMTVDIVQHETVQEALDDYQDRRSSRDEDGYALDDVDHGNDGYLLVFGTEGATIVFLAANFVVEVQALLYQEGGDVDLAEEADAFAEIIAEHIADH